MAKKYIVSLKDIASETGVSVSTVSRVIKEKGEIAAETRERVMEAARKLGYHSNKLIEGMKTGKTRTVGVLISIGDHFFSQIVQGIHNGLTTKGYLPIVVWPKGDGSNEQALIHRLLEQRVEGIIMRPLQDWADTNYFNDVIERGLPIVTVNRKLHAKVDFIGTDDYKGGWLAADHLLRQGHRHIVHFQGPQYASPAILRKQGFAHRMAESSDATHYYIGDAAEYLPESDQVLQFLKDNPQITAMTCFNDYCAAAVFDAAHTLGIRIPEDLAVIGFGALPFGDHLRPQLTTLDQRPFEIGARAVAMLFDQLKQDSRQKEPQEVRIEPELILRGSTTVKKD